MKTLIVMGCLSLGAALMSGPANAAESWVYGIGVNKIVAKEAALATASANLPVGVAFHVVEENFVANGPGVASTGGSTPISYTCNLLVRYGTGVAVPGGVVVYHAHTQAERNAYHAHTEAEKNTKAAGKSGTKTASGTKGAAKATHTKASNKAPRTASKGTHTTNAATHTKK